MTRWTLRISLCFILGVVTTVGVAWGLAALCVWGTEDSTQPGWTRLWSSRRPQGVTELPAHWTSSESFGATTYIGVSSSPVVARLHWITCGWPRASLEGGEWRIGDPQFAGRAVEFVPDGVIGSAHDRLPARNNHVRLGLLPLRPIFPGFLVNTLFYSGVWFGIFFGVATLRRALRKKRGRCVKCSYDLRGAPGDVKGCPECGWGRI